MGFDLENEGFFVVRLTEGNDTEKEEAKCVCSLKNTTELEMLRS